MVLMIKTIKTNNSTNSTINSSVETMDNNNCYDSKLGVFSFLKQIGLSEYYDIFIAKGFDSERDLQFIDFNDLDSMGIDQPKHRHLIISQARVYRSSEEQELYDWLRENLLDYYYINFLQSGRDSLDVIRRMVLPDEEIFDDLEIMLPGHRKRLERAVVGLKRQCQSSSPTAVESPVAYGKWMKPDYLQYAKFDFLCVDATIFSTEAEENQEEIVFMVDSGSDVVTLRPEIVSRLNLVKKCLVRSQGVHVAKEKTLYEAKLKIGSVQLKIELIAEEYNSIGNRVFRHFRHYISGSRHVWLKGDFKDPSMEVITPEEKDETKAERQNVSRAVESQAKMAKSLSFEKNSQGTTKSDWCSRTTAAKGDGCVKKRNGFELDERNGGKENEVREFDLKQMEEEREDESEEPEEEEKEGEEEEEEENEEEKEIKKDENQNNCQLNKINKFPQNQIQSKNSSQKKRFSNPIKINQKFDVFNRKRRCEQIVSPFIKKTRQKLK